MIPLRPFTLATTFGLTAAVAQQPTTPPGVPVPPNAESPATPAGPLGETKITETIEELKINGTSLAGLYRKYTGRRVIVTTAAATAEFSFYQEASPQDPLTYAEAAELLKKAATIENFVFVPDASDPNLDILTLSTGGINPKGRGLEVYNENDELPEGDAVITYVMNFQYLKPDVVVSTFQQVVGQFGAFGSIAAVPNASAVVITENTSLIRKLIELKEQIDKPSSQVGTRFIPVVYADVTELATTLNELFNTQQQTQLTAGVQRANAAATPNVATPNAPAPAVPDATGQGGSASGESTPVQIIPDARTNRIFAMGRPVDLVFIEGLVRQFDTQTDSRNFLRRKLKFLKVAEFLTVAENALNRAFTGTGTGSGAGTAAAGAGGGGNNRTSSNRSNTTNTSQTSFGTNATTGTSQTGGGTGTGSGAGSSLTAPNVSTAPESILVGRTLLVADNITNSIIVQGPPAGLEIMEQLIDQLDVKADQVMISTVFGQLTLGDDLRTGVDWITTLNGARGVAGSIIGTGNNFPDLADLTNPTDFPGTTGLTLYGRIGGDLSAYVNLLQTKTDFTILSRPSVFANNNQRGVISSGQRIAIPTNSFTSVNTDSQSTNIEYRDVVLKLEVVPLINDGDTITLQISLVSDDIVDYSTVAGVGEVPIIGTREILTTVTVPNRQTVVLGGLITQNDSTTVSGVPILSSIPLLGRLFSTNTKNKDRTELMIFIQPSVVTNPSTLDDLQLDMDRRYDVSDDIHRFGNGNNHSAPVQTITPSSQKQSTMVPPRALPVTEAELLQMRNPTPIHRR